VRSGSCISSRIPFISGVSQGSVYQARHCFPLINDVADVFDDLSGSLSLFAEPKNACIR